MTVYRLCKCVITLSPSYAVDKPSFQRLEPDRYSVCPHWSLLMNKRPW